MIKYRFQQCGLTRVVATVDPHYAGSVAVIKKLGMTWLKRDADEHGLWTDFCEIIHLI